MTFALKRIRPERKRQSRRDYWLKNKAKVDKERLKRRKLLVDYLGGKCSVCAYDRNFAALDFHHKDPTTKRFDICASLTRDLVVLFTEARKCILLCSNCHRELHHPNCAKHLSNVKAA